VKTRHGQRAVSGAGPGAGPHRLPRLEWLTGRFGASRVDSPRRRRLAGAGEIFAAGRARLKEPRRSVATTYVRLSFRAPSRRSRQWLRGGGPWRRLRAARVRRCARILTASVRQTRSTVLASLLKRGGPAARRRRALASYGPAWWGRSPWRAPSTIRRWRRKFWPPPREVFGKESSS